ncbi:hypothetical protein JOD57_003480 [Geodermatophilus bullaregiensis]|uniref:hypothetical protein n=1 Tax=Geodermatophilus bullaregiensis TaxID=1564160 RepID=UPI001959B981|nr:hypothetical protein [Geodermatophilus bullaregiensis]MBM7807643.1 hypothetical protein [Geodermatophilus bullaregiensis]
MRRTEDAGGPVRRVWVPQVAVDVEALRVRADVAEARGGLDDAGRALLAGVRRHLDKAGNAAYRRDPLPRRLTNWWRGTLVETAYRHMHAAEVQLVEVAGLEELRAEIRPAVARANAALNREDLRQRTVDDFRQYATVAQLRPRLSATMRDSFAVLDGRHAQLRSFRNILLMSALLVSVLMAVTVAVVAMYPSVLPLCFPREVVDTSTGAAVAREAGVNCPTRSAVTGPQNADVLVVAFLGLLGGALAAAASIRNLKGTTSPYDVPVAVATLKVPLGALTAVLGLIAIRGDFVPGLSALDSQVQILAYALVFGFAQQLLTRLLDQRAQTLLDGLPSKDVADGMPVPLPARPTPFLPDAAREAAPS